MLQSQKRPGILHENATENHRMRLEGIGIDFKSHLDQFLLKAADLEARASSEVR